MGTTTKDRLIESSRLCNFKPDSTSLLSQLLTCGTASASIKFKQLAVMVEYQTFMSKTDESPLKTAPSLAVSKRQ